MKKIIVAFAALAAAFSLASCSKEQIETPSDDIKINIKVANLDGTPDTRAVKTGWVSGDKINIWYEGNSQRNPDLVIMYDGSEWKKDAAATVSGKVPAESGKMFYFYEGGNDLSKYTGSTNTYYGFNLVFGDNYYRPTTYTYTDGIFSADIEYWSPATEFQIVVTDIAPAKYELKCSNLLKMSGFGVTGATFYTANSGYDQYVPGVANEDGAAFYFKTAQDCTASAIYVFTLRNIETAEEKTYTVTGKTHDQSALTAIKIAFGKFSGASGTTGTAKRTGDIDVNWVQLWENGPKFAEYNVGAANNKAEDYGGYYCWGGSIDKDRSRVYKEGTDVLTGNDDTATNLWGSNWRMPTREEFKGLLDNCDVAWTAVNGVNGRMYTGKGDYASNSVFLPASGFFFINLVQDTGSFGYYFSSKPGDSSRAYQMYFSVTGQDMHDGYREMGNSVRAVLAE